MKEPDSGKHDRRVTENGETRFRTVQLAKRKTESGKVTIIEERPFNQSKDA